MTLTAEQRELLEVARGLKGGIHVGPAVDAALAEIDTLRKEVTELKAYRDRLNEAIPLLEEARDALCALTVTQMKLHRISPTLAYRMDTVGIETRWQAKRAAKGGSV